jgi:hypothetical protein
MTQTIWMREITGALERKIFNSKYDDKIFTEVFVDGKNVFGSCLSWLDALMAASVDVGSRSLQGIDYISANTSDPFFGSKPWIDIDLDHANYQRFSCRNVSNFLKFLEAPDIGSNATCGSAESNSSFLMIKRCSMDVTSICLDCRDPCNTGQDYCHSQFLTPCAVPSRCGESFASTKAFILRYKAYSEAVLPRIYSVAFSNVTSNFVTATVNLTGSGFLYCALLLKGAYIL